MKPNPTLNLAFVLCLLAVAFTAKGQYYPGGLGNGNLILWLDAKNSGSITKNALNQVSAWADGSGNGFNFSQATLANSPVYGAAASPTGRPALTFTSTSTQYLSIASLPATLSFTAGISTFSQVSYNAPQTAKGWQRIFDFGNGQAKNNLMTGRDAATANAYCEGWNGASGDQTWTTTNPIVNGTEALYETVQQAGVAGTLTAVSFYLSGAGQAATGQVGSSKTFIPPAIKRTSNYIGRSNWAVDNYFSGTMSEILLYNMAVNTTQRVILENYLSAKWNQAVSVSRFTPPTATTYRTNLIGIGYMNAADNFLADIANATDGLGFSSGSTATDFLNSPGYLMAAHNGQANTILSNTTVSGIGSSVNYWNRSWCLNATGGNSGGTVTLNFSFGNYNGSALPGAANYLLVYNATDGSFSTGTNQVVAVNTAAAGTTVSFATKASTLINGYYTIMWLSSPGQVSPAAVTLCAGGNTGFSVSPINGCSCQWQVNSGSGFSNTPATDPGGAVYNGSTSANLTMTGVTASMNGYTYRALLTAPNGPAIIEGPATLTVNPLPAAQPIQSAAPAICAGSGTTLSIQTPVSGIDYHIYSDAALTIPVGILTSASNSLPVSPAVTTTYYEQGVDATTGCVQSAAAQSVTVTVNPLPAAQPILSAAPAICAGSGTTLSIQTPVSGTDYHIYSDAALTVPVGILTSASNNLPVVLAVTTTYYEQGVDATTGCVQSATAQSVTVTVNPLPAAQPILSAAAAICAGSGTALSIQTPVPGIDYHIYSDAALTVPVGILSNASNSLPVSPAATTTYYEQGVDATTGCVQSAAAERVMVTVNPLPTLTVQGKPLICLGDSLTLTASAPGATIAWSGYGAGDSITLTPAATATYSAIATTAAGCADTSTLTVTVSSWQLSLAANPNPVEAGFPVTLSTGGTASYKATAWEPATEFTNQQAISQTFVMLDTGKTYTVIATSLDGCTDTASVAVTTLTNSTDVFIPNAFTPNGDGHNDVFRIYGSSIRQVELNVFNQWGQLVFSSEDVNAGWDGRFRGVLQPPGPFLYTARILLNGRTSPIIKKGSISLIR